MSNFKLEGKLIVKEDTVQVSDNFTKRDFVIEVINAQNEKYNDFVKFQLIKDKCDIIDNIAIGQTIVVNFNIKGKKWEKDGNTSYFVNLDAWRIETAGSSYKQTNASTNHPEAAPLPEEDFAKDDEGGDQLPF